MDKALQRQKTRERVKRYREKHKSVTLDSVTPLSVTKQGLMPDNVTPFVITDVTPLDEGQRLHHGASPGATVLSDGQLWYPNNNGYHPKDCHCTAHRDRSPMFDWCYAYRITKQGTHLIY